MTSKYGTSVIRRFANRVPEVQYRTLEPTAERRRLRHAVRDSRRSERDSTRIDGRNLDVCVSNLVTVVEEADFTAVAAPRPTWSGAFCQGKTRSWRGEPQAQI